MVNNFLTEEKDDLRLQKCDSTEGLWEYAGESIKKY